MPSYNIQYHYMAQGMDYPDIEKFNGVIGDNPEDAIERLLIHLQVKEENKKWWKSCLSVISVNLNHG